MCFTVRL